MNSSGTVVEIGFPSIVADMVYGPWRYGIMLIGGT